MTKTGCVLAFLLVAAAAVSPAQTAPAAPASPPISYVGGQLRINVLDSTLADVLTKVAALTGVKIEVPAGVGDERMPVVEVGPGPARQVLASLLSDSNFDYLIQASDTDPEKIQSVLLLPRPKKGGGANAVDAAVRPSRNPYARAGAPAKPEEAPAPDPPAEITVAQAGPSNPPPPDPSAPSAPAPDASMQLSPTQPGQWNIPKVAPQPVPGVLSPDSISQQLQQMYQQRAQMVQQDRQAAAPANSSGR